MLGVRYHSLGGDLEDNPYMYPEAIVMPPALFTAPVPPPAPPAVLFADTRTTLLAPAVLSEPLAPVLIEQQPPAPAPASSSSSSCFDDITLLVPSSPPSAHIFPAAPAAEDNFTFDVSSSTPSYSSSDFPHLSLDFLGSNTSTNNNNINTSVIPFDITEEEAAGSISELEQFRTWDQFIRMLHSPDPSFWHPQHTMYCFELVRLEDPSNPIKFTTWQADATWGILPCGFHAEHFAQVLALLRATVHLCQPNSAHQLFEIPDLSVLEYQGNFATSLEEHPATSDASAQTGVYSARLGFVDADVIAAGGGVGGKRLQGLHLRLSFVPDKLLSLFHALWQ